ncbi:SET domain-containing protein [Epithele typhae]|uniref:SET domain-containing protein n=1 Tax=Epithele typhae TaxID=378194 RepID=UPI0020078530|nr:SET domain-containing protein [Epithele typhae]KAH9927455.1 SET domain-containing protein [Epithele typhae]
MSPSVDGRELPAIAPSSGSGSSRRGVPPGLRARDVERRERFKEQWNEAAKEVDAAAVTIVNEVNGEGAPPRLVEDFKYLERRYQVREELEQTRREGLQLLVSCSCKEKCKADKCDCQDPSEYQDPQSGDRKFAYSKKGLFTFRLPRGMEAIECNQASYSYPDANCACGEVCRNRVAQRPRDVPIEVFRTLDRGWGARATIPLQRGRVVGIYTGCADTVANPRVLLLKPTPAQRTDDGERRSYIFDLDVHENGEEDDGDDNKFSVDAWSYGNWTRFINHSCSPNMRVYPVVWDTIPELNQPYLAFVVTRDLQARTELTIDYDPKAAHPDGSDAQPSSQLERPRGARDCMCGADGCRGWVSV